MVYGAYLKEYSGPTGSPRPGRVTVDIDANYGLLHGGSGQFSSTVGNVTALHPDVVVFCGGGGCRC